jgi:hypothetical protein
VIGAQRDDIISAANLLIQMREKLAEILVQPHKSVMPSAKYSCSGSLERFANGNIAIDRMVGRISPAPAPAGMLLVLLFTSFFC